MEIAVVIVMVLFLAMLITVRKDIEGRLKKWNSTKRIIK
jgi:septation ring formation regulator EzrA